MFSRHRFYTFTDEVHKVAKVLDGSIGSVEIHFPLAGMLAHTVTHDRLTKTNQRLMFFFW